MEEIYMLNTRIYNQAFWSKMRGTLINHDDLKDGQIDGGYQLPNDSLDKFYKALERDNLFRRLATVLSLTNLEGTVHATTSTGSAGVVEEGNLIPEDGDKFTQFPVRSYKIASIAKLKESFVSDNDFNLEKYLNTDFARRFGRAEEDLFINGNRTTEPTGILSVSESINAKATNTLSYDEFQGDNLLLARENLLHTFIDNVRDKLKREPSLKELKRIATIISWNLWQMDGLTFAIPFSELREEYQQMSLFENLEDLKEKPKDKYCKIKNWRSNIILEYRTLLEGRKNG
jgi:hypothetical protein